MKRTWMIRLGITLIFLAAILLLYSIFGPGNNGEEEFQTSLQEEDLLIPTEEEGPHYPAPSVTIDFEGLLEINEEITGWIWIPDSPINYPVLRGDDNQKYLTRSYKGTYDRNGSVFMDYRCQPDYTTKHTILFGHNMLTEDIFGTLERYKDPEYLNSHSMIYILTPDGYQVYQVFSIHDTDAYGETYRVHFDSDDRYQQYLDEMTELSLQPLEITPDSEDLVLTLSTCTSHGNKNDRFVVQAVLQETVKK